MLYDPGTNHFEQIAWGAAFALIAVELNKLDDPDQAEFYTSGRASNEAAFLYQLFVRLWHQQLSRFHTYVTGPPAWASEAHRRRHGDCPARRLRSCHAIFSFGRNPGTNHPRMMSTLMRRRAAVFQSLSSTLKERALERFAAPQDPVEMVTLSSTPIASAYHQVRVGGDLAALKGIMKVVLERDVASLAAGGAGILDRPFIDEHTLGYEVLRADIEATTWQEIVAVSGLARHAIESAADVYANARNVIVCYGMGITQHAKGTYNVQQIANLLMLRGNIGREGAGIAPIRGHSNMQGDRTVGITEIPNNALLDGMERAFGFRPPSEKGHNAIEAVEAATDG